MQDENTCPDISRATENLQECLTEFFYSYHLPKHSTTAMVYTQINNCLLLLNELFGCIDTSPQYKFGLSDSCFASIKEINSYRKVVALTLYPELCNSFASKRSVTIFTNVVA